MWATFYEAEFSYLDAAAGIAPHSDQTDRALISISGWDLQ